MQRLIFALCAGFVIYLFLQDPLTTRWLDFPVYYTAAQKTLAHHTVYDVTDHFQFKYSPFASLLFAWTIGPLDFSTASVVFQKTMLFLWIGFFVLSLGMSLQLSELFWLFLIFANALKLDLELGQINALPLLLLLYFFKVLRRRPILAPLALALALQIKLYVAVVFLLLLFKWAWRPMVLSILFSLALALGVPALVHGSAFALSEFHAWVTTLTQSSKALLDSSQNVSIVGVLGTTAFYILFPLACWGLFKVRKLSLRRQGPLYMAMVFLFNPLVWSYWVLTLVPLFGVLIRAPKTKTLLALFFYAWIAFNSQHAHWAWRGGILVGALWATLIGYKMIQRKIDNSINLV